LAVLGEIMGLKIDENHIQFERHGENEIDCIYPTLKQFGLTGDEMQTLYITNDSGDINSLKYSEELINYIKENL
jgi:hypothetical protein